MGYKNFFKPLQFNESGIYLHRFSTLITRVFFVSTGRLNVSSIRRLLFLLAMALTIHI